MLKKIFESTLIMGTSSALVLMLDLVRVKILAVFLGPSGVGVLSVLNHFHTLAVTCIGLGLGTGIVKYVSSFKHIGDEPSVQSVLSNSFYITFFLSFLGFAVSVFLSPQLSHWMLSDTRYSVFIVLYAISFPLAVFPITTNSFLQGLMRIKSLAKINVLRSSISLLFIIPLVYFFRLRGAVLSVIIITTVHLLLNAFYLGKEEHRYSVVKWPSFDADVLKKLFQYGLTSLLVGTAYYLSHLLLKIIIVSSLGLEMNGIYQPIWALTMTYLTLVLSSMSAYSYPRLCELEAVRDINEELNGIIRVAVLLITPAMFFLLLARGPIIQLLYSRQFLAATEFMPIQILGDFFKVLFWSVGMYLLPTRRLVAFIWSNLLQDVVMVVLAYILVDTYQLYGIAASFALSYLVGFIVLYWYTKNRMSFSLWTKNRRLLVSSFGGLLAITIGEMYLALGQFIALVAVVILLWAFFSIKRNEVVQLKDYVSEKIFKHLPSSDMSSP
jgi:O-antigen/teichoic acid export membrane protein